MADSNFYQRGRPSLSERETERETERNPSPPILSRRVPITSRDFNADRSELPILSPFRSIDTSDFRFVSSPSPDNTELNRALSPEEPSILEIANELQYKIIMNLDLESLAQWLAVNKTISQGKDDAYLFKTWVRKNRPDLLDLYLRALKERTSETRSGSTPYEIIVSLIGNSRLGEIASTDSYLLFGRTRIARLAGRQRDLTLYKYYVSILGMWSDMIGSFLIGVLEGSDIFLNKGDPLSIVNDYINYEFLPILKDSDSFTHFINELRVYAYCIGLNYNPAIDPIIGFQIPWITDDDLGDLYQNEEYFNLFLELSLMYQNKIYSHEESLAKFGLIPYWYNTLSNILTAHIIGGHIPEAKRIIEDNPEFKAQGNIYLKSSIVALLNSYRRRIEIISIIESMEIGLVNLSGPAYSEGDSLLIREIFRDSVIKGYTIAINWSQEDDFSTFLTATLLDPTSLAEFQSDFESIDSRRLGKSTPPPVGFEFIRHYLRKYIRALILADTSIVIQYKVLKFFLTNYPTLKVFLIKEWFWYDPHNPEGQVPTYSQIQKFLKKSRLFK